MMAAALSLLGNYLLYLLPGLALHGVWFGLTPRHLMGLRIAILLLGFVLLRDVMTPLQFWTLGAGAQIGFIANPWVLAGLGLLSLATLAGLARIDPPLWALVIWVRRGWLAGIGVGLLAGAALGVPLRLYAGIGLEPTMGPWLLGMAVLALGGNALEEVLFRGLLQGYLEQRCEPWRAALLSAVAFAACHGFLAFSVTRAGWPVLLFTLLEGLICAGLRWRHGVLAAIAAHATAIWLIAVPM
ncbi:MAG: type II CAAX prenyl endopeptidase Rce1 family protein [Pseudomonas sp.]|uniref:CPBP family glutamic-type intramembrane protease n=1 Tax=Pseudomonas sp. TaxID=306 RepID=UPI003D1010B7